MINADVLLSGDTLIYAAGHGTDRRHPGDNILNNAMTARIDAIAQSLNIQYNMGLTGIPRTLRIGSDHGAFFYAGHTVVWLLGGGYTGSSFSLEFLHDASDYIQNINANAPGRMERNMRAFSIFLEELLLMRG